MDGKFGVKIYTPAGLVLDDETDEITFAGIDGQLGALPGHAQYAGLLGTGIVQFHSLKQSRVVRAVLAGGFSQINDGTLTFLADSVHFPEDISPGQFDDEEQTLKEILSEGNLEDPERVHAAKEMEKIRALRELISN